MLDHKYAKPLVSVIIPTYNRTKVICRAIDSVLNQTYQNWELIIVDDGSTDATKKKITPYLKNKKIKYFKKKHSGVSASRNFGLKKAKGAYISFLDSDDEYLNNRLEKQLHFMIYKNALFSLSKAKFCIENDSLTTPKGYILLRKHYLENYQDISNIPVSATLMMYKKTVFKTTEFDRKIQGPDDLDFLLQILKKAKILFVSDFLNIINKSKKIKRVSNDQSTKIISFKRVLNKVAAGFYKLSPSNKELIERVFNLNIAKTYLLMENLKFGRTYLKHYLKLEKKFSLKYFIYQIIYFLTFFSIPFKILLKNSRNIWWVFQQRSQSLNLMKFLSKNQG